MSQLVEIVERTRSVQNADSGPIVRRQILALSAAGAVELATGATDTLFGVSQPEAAAAAQPGDYLSAIVGGKVVLESGDAIDVGDLVTSDATSRPVPVNPAAGDNVNVLGLAVTAATGAGEPVEIELSPLGTQVQGPGIGL